MLPEVRVPTNLTQTCLVLRTSTKFVSVLYDLFPELVKKVEVLRVAVYIFSNIYDKTLNKYETMPKLTQTVQLNIPCTRFGGPLRLFISASIIVRHF